ncbi:hypothetical protein FACS1894139_15770 [Planctomycetales bacterium]|nr:hypothetical protein FACS1894107_13140 [Planctomycetales bacterium]GHT07449.1 hypothetical protein FACS1894139_15770 [Planctomycetales bacterium]
MSDSTNDNRTILAIDFGTCNSCLATCATDNNNVELIHLDNTQNGTISTAVLYCDRDDANPEVLSVGEKAIETYGECDEDEIAAKKYRFQAMFKPDIVKSEPAKCCATDFLSGILRVAQQKSLPLSPKSARVIFGVPSEAGEDFKQALKNIARDAGFGEVETMPEPVGALFADLGLKQIELADALAGYLVVDFGGGTCDFALMQNGAIVASWGDMHLGGRLLDDLFYQWFAEQNQELAEKAEKNGEDFFTMVQRCRKLKEWFSDTLLTDPKYSGSKKVGDTGGRISDLNKENFLRRARDYRPSATFVKIYEHKMRQKLPEKLTADESVDLIAWFENCLEDGLRKAGKTWQNIKVVSLAGGSSLWFFVKEYLESKQVKLSRHKRPMDAIAEGLARSVSIKKRFATLKEEIGNHLGKFFEEEIAPSLVESLDNCAEHLAEKTVAVLFDENIKPILREFRQEGGSISDLKEKIAAAVKRRQAQITEDAKIIVAKSIRPLSAVIREKLRAWLKEKYGINLPDAADENYATGEHQFNHEGLIDAGMVDGFIIAIGALISVIISWILLFGGPIGWIIGIIAVICGGAATAGPLQSWVLKRGLGDEKIYEMRKKMSGQIYRKFAASLRGFTDEEVAKFTREGVDAKEASELKKASKNNLFSQMMISVRKATDAEIERLGAVNML